MLSPSLVSKVEQIVMCTLIVMMLVLQHLGGGRVLLRYECIAFEIDAMLLN